MRRGTRVGQAYVAVTADGSGINEEIADSVDAAGKDIDDKGREHGDKYGEGFSDGFLDRMRNKVGARLSTVMDGKVAGGRAGDDAGDSFVDRMTDKVRGLGEKIGNEISDRVASNPEGVRRGVDRAFSDDMADRVGTRFAHQFLDSLEHRIGDGDSRIGAAIAAMMDNAVSGNGSGGSGSKGGKDKGGLSSIVTRLLGGGSRNNVLNTFGKTMGGIVGLVEKGAGLAGKFAEGFKSAADGASLVEKAMSGFSSIGLSGAGLGGSLSSFAASAPLAAAAAGVLLLAFSALASIAGALVAILTALASTIASALVGAVAIAAPLLGALAVAGGLVVNAFTSMTNAQKDYLFSAFQPFKAALTGIGQIIMQQFVKPLYDGMSAVQVWSANLQQALRPLAVVASSTAKAFADAGNIITASLSGPGFQQFFASLGTYLPNIITKLANALGGFLNGVASMFAAIMPSVSRFSDYLSRTADRFSAWASSFAGQNAIRDFVDRAIVSIKSLWGFLKQVGGLIADVFFNSTSQNAGNSIFDSIADAVYNMRVAIRKAIANGDLRRWMEDGIKFGGALWGAIKAIYKIFLALYNSGVLTMINNAFNIFAAAVNLTANVLVPLADGIGALPGIFGTVLGPLHVLSDAITAIHDQIKFTLDLIAAASKIAGIGNGVSTEGSGSGSFNDFYGTSTVPGVTSNGGIMGPWAPGTAGNPMPYMPPLDDLITLGNTALNNTYESAGGYMPDPTQGSKPAADTRRYELGQVEEDWINPYIEFANSLLAKAPTIKEEIRTAARAAKFAITTALKEANESFAAILKDMGKTAVSGVIDASQSTDVLGIVSSFQNMIDQMGEQMSTIAADGVDRAAAIMADAQAAADSLMATAQAGRDAALAKLASATTPKEAKAAKAELEEADRNYNLAKRKAQDIMQGARQASDQLIANSTASTDRLAAAQNILAWQGVMTEANVNDLVSGYGSATATLADYAEARRIVLDKLAAANQNLTEAIALRDNYASAVTDSIKTFGALTTAQAKTLNGVAQSLTVEDITTNLQDRLTKIKTFQENLRQLLAMGLSQDAYKQLVDAGVETGGAFAEAILAGGQGGISEVNDLTSQINTAADGLGTEAADQMYAAGVAAAQGIVDGLNSLANELETAATALGLAIAQAIRDALGIASPSKVLMADMEHVGDGTVMGLDNQHDKVSAAGARLAGAISVSPEVAAYAAQQAVTAGGPVSGNPEDNAKVVWTGNIVTPTEDPVAVANEVLNELTGRLP